MAADLELDSTKEAAEAQIMAATGALGRYAPLIAAFCRSKCACLQEFEPLNLNPKLNFEPDLIPS